MGFHERHEGGFVSGQFFQKVGVGISRAQLFGHVAGDVLDLGPALGFEKDVVKVEFGVFHNFDPQVIKGLDGRVAGQKILGPRSEAENLESADAEDDARGRNEIGHHVGDRVGQAERSFGDERPQLAQAAIVGCVEKSAVGVAAAADEIGFRFLGGGGEHDRPAEFLGHEGRRPFRTEVPEIDGERVRAAAPGLVQGLEGVGFAFDDGLEFDERKAFGPAGLGGSDPPHSGEFDGKAVAADGDKSDEDIGNIDQGFHLKTPSSVRNRRGGRAFFGNACSE